MNTAASSLIFLIHAGPLQERSHGEQFLFKAPRRIGRSGPLVKNIRRCLAPWFCDYKKSWSTSWISVASPSDSYNVSIIITIVCVEVLDRSKRWNGRVHMDERAQRVTANDGVLLCCTFIIWRQDAAVYLFRILFPSSARDGIRVSRNWLGEASARLISTINAVRKFHLLF